MRNLADTNLAEQAAAASDVQHPQAGQRFGPPAIQPAQS